MGRTFNGTSDKIAHTGFNLTSGQSFSMYIRFRTNTANDVDLWGVREGDPTNSGRMTMIRMISNGEIHFNHDFLADTTNNLATTTGTYNDDAWHTALCTYDGTNLRIYIDGVADGVSGSVSNLLLTTSNAWVFATRSDFNAEWFPGELAEAAAWKDRVITAAEAVAFGKNYAPHHYLNNLIFYMPIIGKTSPEIEIIGGDNGTVTGATVFPHPPIILPKAYYKRRFTTDAAPGGDTYPGYTGPFGFF